MSEQLHYYIGTGAKECYYTLRYRFTETVWFRTEAGTESRGVERDYHVRNLSTDRETAIAKAREITGRGLNADFEVRDITREQDIDWSIFRAGKYTGKSIHEVAELDKGYLVFMCENMAQSKSYAKTLELAKALVAHELATRAQDRDEAKLKAEQDAKELAAAAAPIVAILKGASRQPGDFCASMADQLERGHRVYGRALDIVEDIYAKAHGRRNSKAYAEALNAARTILESETINETRP
jgi:hypothetical protein